MEVDGLEAGGVEGMAASNRITGVDSTRREEIHQFLAERFTEYHKVDPMVREAAWTLVVARCCPCARLPHACLTK